MEWCPKDVKTVHDKVRDPHNIRLPHEQLHAALSRAKQGRTMVSDKSAWQGIPAEGAFHDHHIHTCVYTVCRVQCWHRRRSRGIPERLPRTMGHVCVTVENGAARACSEQSKAASKT